MRFMMIVKANKDSEAGMLPDEAMLTKMGKFNEELVNAGVLVDATGLQASSKGTRVKFAKDGKVSVIDGPFAETKELIAGYWVINVKSLQDAIDWAKKSPNPHGDGAETAIEIRQFFEMEDFGESPAVDDARKLEKKLTAQKQKK
jgi:hypothetical protein